jgi:hypothetical protein
MPDKSMNIDASLRVLVECLTRDDPEMGFTIQNGFDRYGRHTMSEYVEAWENVRMYLGLNVNPSPTPTDPEI